MQSVGVAILSLWMWLDNNTVDMAGILKIAVGGDGRGNVSIDSLYILLMTLRVVVVLVALQ